MHPATVVVIACVSAINAQIIPPIPAFNRDYFRTFYPASKGETVPLFHRPRDLISNWANENNDPAMTHQTPAFSDQQTAQLDLLTDNSNPQRESSFLSKGRYETMTPLQRPQDFISDRANEQDNYISDFPKFSSHQTSPYNLLTDFTNSQWHSNPTDPLDLQSNGACSSNGDENSYLDHGFDQFGDSVPKPWQAPPYRNSLKDFDDAIATIESHFKPDAFMDRDNNNFRYIVLTQIIDLLSKTVAEEGWEPYERNYTRLVLQAMESTILNPQRAVRLLECSIIEPAIIRLEKVRTIIYNSVVNFLCEAQPTSCDAVVFAALNINNDKELENGLDLLLSLGKAASLFLNSYANTFEAISTQNVFLYIINSKNKLRDLVSVNAEARRQLHPYGSGLCF